MTAPVLFTPYSTVRGLMTALPTWIPDLLDQERVMSYQIYEQIYWGMPETFKIVARGTEDKPIYVPTGRVIVDTTDRYTATGFDISVDLRTGGDASVSADAQAVQLAFEDLFTRERFKSKFNGNKLYGLIRGDWLWHIVADDTKAPGTRISIYPLDPASYFPIWDENDLDKIVGCHIVDTIQIGNDQFIKRLTYRKLDTGGITSEEALFAVDDWGGPESKPKQIISPPTSLPPAITALPVYHIKNFEEPANPFGSSEMRGLERIIASVNQTISDEELALALEGLGMYATDAPPPIDDTTGLETSWQLGPGRVVEHPGGTKFERITGVGSVKPSQDHLAFLLGQLHEAAGTPDVARGKVEVKVAESGISLMLQMSPMLARVAPKDQLVKDSHDQMFFDLVNGWFPAYEQTSFGDARVKTRLGEKLPIDRAARFKELNDMLDKGVISSVFYRAEATKLGYKFPDTLEAEIASDNAAKAAAVDPFGARIAGGP